MNTKSNLRRLASLVIVLGSGAPAMAQPAAADVADDASGPFVFQVADVMKITGAGTLLVGKVESGRVSTGDAVCLAGLERPLEVAAIEQFNRVLTTVDAGQRAGLLFEDLDRDAVTVPTRVHACD
ncbi:MAG: hypothetical protein RIC56_12935 [Pseudomonadales bacterium]